MTNGALKSKLSSPGNGWITYPLSVDPACTADYVNLADLYCVPSDEAKAEKALRRAAEIIPESAGVHHVLGLSLVRQERMEEGVKELKRAATQNRDNALYPYVYSVAPNSTGKPEHAIMIVQGAHNALPNDRDIASALVALHRDSGNEAAARNYTQRLSSMSP